MQKLMKAWDYLIVTAANDPQAGAYELQIEQRRQAGEIPQVRSCLVVPDIEGKRIGSGGSTLHCLDQVLQRERPGGVATFADGEAILSGLRILIVHAGGDSRRLPAYSHCGKMFVPVPEKGIAGRAVSLFDRLAPALLSLPEAHPGQVVVASGDALILFDAKSLDLSRCGITALGSIAPAHEAAKHGVFCADPDGSVRRFRQKPSRDQQVAWGVVNAVGDSVLDLGVMSFEAGSAIRLMRPFFESKSEEGALVLAWKPEAHAALLSHGIDLYREICCALGKDTTLDQYVESARSAGSTLDRTLLAEWFSGLHPIPFHVDILPGSRFLHFGTTRQLITTSAALRAEDSGKPASGLVVMNSDVQADIVAGRAWIEGCSVHARLTLAGDNALVGVDVVKPLNLPHDACLDICEGVSRASSKVWFLRYCHIDDTFKDMMQSGGSFCGRPLQSWLGAMGAVDSDIWPVELPAGERTLWSARVFPAIAQHQDFREWLWLFEPDGASAEQKAGFLKTDRYSSAEIALRVDQGEFHQRRLRMGSAGHPRGALPPSQAESYTVDC